MTPVSDYQMLSTIFNGKPPIDEDLANRLFSLFPAEEVIEFASDVANNVENYLLSAVRCADDVGQISYYVALGVASYYSLTKQFVIEYGMAEEWVDIETGNLVGIDLGELLQFLREKEADLW